MANNRWLPPLTVPIPKGHACHYANDNDYLMKITDPALVPVYKKILWHLYQLKNKPPEYGKADAFYRVFAKRSVDKKEKYRSKILYVLFDHRHDFVAVIDTLRQSKKIMSNGFMLVERMGRKQRIDLKPGSYLLKTINGRTLTSFDRSEAIEERVPQVILTKKCDDCPNQNSVCGLCHCAFWGSIRDGMRPWQFLSTHEIRTKRRRKKQDLKLDVRIVLH